MFVNNELTSSACHQAHYFNKPEDYWIQFSCNQDSKIVLNTSTDAVNDVYFDRKLNETVAKHMLSFIFSDSF